MKDKIKRLKKHYQDMFNELLEHETKIYTLENFILSSKFIALKNKESNKHIDYWIKKLEFMRNYKTLLEWHLTSINDDIKTISKK